MDATVWPTKTEQATEALNMLCNICSLGQGNIGHIQLPQVHSQTSLGAVCKNRNRIQDSLLKAGMDFSQTLTLGFSKETVRAGSEKRPATQSCFVATGGKTSKWSSSEMLQAGLLNNLPLIKVSDMEGYDAESRPNAAQRMEQNLGLQQLSNQGLFQHSSCLACRGFLRMRGRQFIAK